MLEEAGELGYLVAQSRKETGAGLATRQREAIEELAVTNLSEHKRCVQATEESNRNE